MKLLSTLSKLFNINGKNINYENHLLEKYGKCFSPNKSITILAIADTHNCLSYDDDIINFLKTNLSYDCCILLGDHSANDLYKISQIIPKHKIYGVPGNHDSWDKYDDLGITNINGKIIKLNGVKIAGLGGSFKYKNSDNYALYTHEESIQILNNMETADIIVTHDRPFIRDNNDVAHDGLKGITEYIYANHIPVNIHGHLHENNVEYLKNGTKVIGIYGAKIIHYKEENSMIKKSDWKNIDMPELNEFFILKRKLTSQDIELIKKGHLPKQMEDKWFMFFENNKLFIHRSWTGFCIYIVDINDTGKLKTIVNRDHNQYTEKNIKKDKVQLDNLLNILLK